MAVVDHLLYCVCNLCRILMELLLIIMQHCIMTCHATEVLMFILFMCVIQVLLLISMYISISQILWKTGDLHCCNQNSKFCRNFKCTDIMSSFFFPLPLSNVCVFGYLCCLWCMWGEIGHYFSLHETVGLLLLVHKQCQINFWLKSSYRRGNLGDTWILKTCHCSSINDVDHCFMMYCPSFLLKPDKASYFAFLSWCFHISVIFFFLSLIYFVCVCVIWLCIFLFTFFKAYKAIFVQYYVVYVEQEHSYILSVLALHMF